MASKIAVTDTRYLATLHFIKQERSKKVITEICFYSGIVSLSLLFGAAAVINPLGALMLGLGFYGVSKNA